MTEIHNSNSVRRPNHRAASGKNRCAVAKNVSRISHSPFVAILLIVVGVPTLLAQTRQLHYLSLLSTMIEMETKHDDEMVNPSNIRHHFLIPSSIAKRKEDHNNNKNIGTSNNQNLNLRLRYDWTKLSPSLDLTKHIVKHQSNCSLPMSTFTYRNRFGLGSDIHVYSQALGYGIETNRRIRTVGNWTWMDQSECGNTNNNNAHVVVEDGSSSSSETIERGLAARGFLESPMRCYFATSELNCPGDVEYAIANPGFDTNNGGLSKANGNMIARSGDYLSAILPSKKDGGEQQLQTAVVESLFTRLTPRVVREAERQLNLVFGGKDRVPKDLITVHIRWGDKVAAFQGKKRKRMPEMKKVGISDYIVAVNQILDQREKRENASSKFSGQAQLASTNKIANIYLATEDPEAVREFRKALPVGWNLFVDQFLVDTSRHRVDEYNGSPKMATALNGKAGLLALGSLLVAMEANDFVLTTASNWSQLMDELRRAILDPRCDSCTSMIDLRQKHYYTKATILV